MDIHRKRFVDIYRLLGFGGLSLFLVFPYCRLLSRSFVFQIIIIGILWLSISLWDRLYLSKPEEILNRNNDYVLTNGDYLFVSVIFWILYWYQKKFLYAPIAWKGDEDFHVIGAVDIFRVYVQPAPFRLLWVLVPLSVIFYFLNKNRERTIYVKAIYFALFCLIPLKIPYLINYRIARYPPFLLVAESIFANRFFSSDYLEPVHRLVVFLPYLLTFLVCFLAVRSLNLPSPFAYMLPLALISAPLMYYHATVVYIEMTLVLIQFIIIYKILKKPKIDNSFLFKLAALAGFMGVIKETSLPFLLSLLIFMIMKIYADQKESGKPYIPVLKLAYLMFLPISLYLFFRTTYGNPRPYEMMFGNLINPATYSTYLKAINQQFTLPFFLISTIGLLYLLKTKKHPNAVIVALLNGFFCFVMLSMVDFRHLGYSRFNLYFLPSIFVGMVGFGYLLEKIAKNSRWGPHLTTFCLGAIIAFNMYSSPKNFINRSNWGSYNADIAEYYLPYPEAVKYISNYPVSTTFAAGGMNYHYGALGFYLHKFGIRQNFLGQWIGPRHKTGFYRAYDLTASIRKSREKQADLLLFHNLFSHTPVSRDYPGVKFVKRFTLGEHALDLYELKKRPAWVNLPKV